MRYYQKSLKATVLIDSVAAGNLKNEWGLSLFLEYNDKTLLLDTGCSQKFLQNAQILALDMEKVDAGILSHAHYDHADGLKYFFAANKKALPYYVYRNKTAAGVSGSDISA